MRRYLEYIPIQCQVRHCEDLISQRVQIIAQTQVCDFVSGQVECLDLVAVLEEHVNQLAEASVLELVV